MSVESSRTNAVRLMRDENQRLKNAVAQLQAQVELQTEFVRTLYELQNAGGIVGTEAELPKFMGQVAEAAVHGCQCAEGSLLLVDSDSDELVFVQVRNNFSTTLSSFRLQKGEGIPS